MKINKLTLIIVLIIMLSPLLTSCNTSNSVSSLYNNGNNETVAYNFELLDLEGNTHKLTDYQGKKVYIKIWGTWCSACVSGLDELEELYIEKLDSDIVVLTIVAPKVSGELSEEKFKEWYYENNYNFKVLLDPEATTFSGYGIRAFPTSLFITTDGILSAKKVGHQSNSSVDNTFSDMD